MKLLQKTQMIKEYIFDVTAWVSPTDLGMVIFNKSYGSASGYVNNALKELVSIGWLERNNKGEYRRVIK